MKSPYLQDHRLADVVGAVQAMSNYPWASRKADEWIKVLGQPMSAEGWNMVFKEHPELFRLTDQGWATLRWRHIYLRTYDPKQQVELNEAQRQALSPDQEEDLTYKPLAADQTETLIKSAIEFHARAVAHEQERRWLSPLPSHCLALYSHSLAPFSARASNHRYEPCDAQQEVSAASLPERRSRGGRDAAEPWCYPEKLRKRDA